MSDKLTPLRLFFSYSHADEKMRDELAKHLRILERQGFIEGWHDRSIEGGANWESEILNHLRAADIILLLVSADFLASDYCWDIEMKGALDRHENGAAKVIPVILRPCSWQAAPFGKLQALPKDGKPVVDWPSLDHGFLEVVSGITKATTTRPLASPAHKSHAHGVFYVPVHRTRHFVGRNNLLQQTRDMLAGSLGLPAIVALTGIGGTGKTQLAAQYAEKFRGQYQLVWWLSAEEPTAAQRDLGELARHLKCDFHDDPNPAVRAYSAMEWLKSNDNWLLVLDNVPGVDAATDLIPEGGSGHVIATSRNRGWERLGTAIAVPVLGEDAAAELLATTTGAKIDEHMRNVVRALGNLPLAIVQAAAFMDAKGINAAEYLNLFETKRTELWNEEAKHAPKDHPKAVHVTVELALKNVQLENLAAVDFLKICCFLAPEQITPLLFSHLPDVVPSNLQSIASDPVALSSAWRTLAKYGLIALDLNLQSISLHRLVQLALQDTMTDIEKKRWLSVALDILFAAMPEEQSDPQFWPFYFYLAPHFTYITDQCARLGVRSPALIAVLNWMGLFLGHIGFLQSAEDCFRSAARNIDESQVPFEPLDISSTFGNLSGNLISQGRSPEALPFIERALRNSKEFTGLQDPNLGTHLSNHGMVLASLGRYAEANDSLSRGMEVIEQEHGSSDWRLVWSLGYKGNIEQMFGNLTAARDAYKRSLEIQRLNFGDTRPYVLIALHNLARTEMLLGDLDSAHQHALEAVQVGKKSLPPHHPMTARPENLLVEILSRMRRKRQEKNWSDSS
jgi:tetratricopeptide (TPR) repeat protein